MVLKYLLEFLEFDVLSIFNTNNIRGLRIFNSIKSHLNNTEHSRIQITNGDDDYNNIINGNIDNCVASPRSWSLSQLYNNPVETTTVCGPQKKYPRQCGGNVREYVKAKRSAYRLRRVKSTIAFKTVKCPRCRSCNNLIQNLQCAATAKTRDRCKKYVRERFRLNAICEDQRSTFSKSSCASLGRVSSHCNGNTTGSDSVERRESVPQSSVLRQLWKNAAKCVLVIKAYKKKSEDNSARPPERYKHDENSGVSRRTVSTQCSGSITGSDSVQLEENAPETSINCQRCKKVVKNLESNACKDQFKVNKSRLLKRCKQEKNPCRSFQATSSQRSGRNPGSNCVEREENAPQSSNKRQWWIRPSKRLENNACKENGPSPPKRTLSFPTLSSQCSGNFTDSDSIEPEESVRKSSINWQRLKNIAKRLENKECTEQSKDNKAGQLKRCKQEERPRVTFRTVGTQSCGSITGSDSMEREETAPHTSFMRVWWKRAAKHLQNNVCKEESKENGASSSKRCKDDENSSGSLPTVSSQWSGSITGSDCSEHEDSIPQNFIMWQWRKTAAKRLANNACKETSEDNSASPRKRYKHDDNNRIINTENTVNKNDCEKTQGAKNVK